MSRNWLLKAQEIVVQVIERDGVLDSADFKTHLETSRKYALAVLDFLDARKVLIRHGNHRKLSGNYRANMIQ